MTHLPGRPGVAAAPAAAVPIATQVAQFLAQGPGGSQRDLFGSGRRQRLLLSVRPAAGWRGDAGASPGRARHRRGPARRRRSSAPRRRRALHHWSVNVPDMGRRRSASLPARPRRSPHCRRSSTRRCSARSTPPGIPTMRVNTFALFNEIARKSGELTASERDATPACGATPSLVCTSANFVAPNAAQTYRLRQRRASDDGRARDHRADYAHLVDHRSAADGVRWPKLRSPWSRRISARSTTACGRVSMRRAARASSRHGRPTTTATRTCRRDRTTAAGT